MKRNLKKLLSVILVCTLFLSVPAVSAGAASAVNAIPMSIWDEGSDSLFEKLANYLIKIVHEIIVLFRFPWNASDKEVDLSGYDLVFEDEFEGTALSDNWWDYAGALRKGGYWNKEQAFVEDGNLIIRTQYKEDGANGAGYYTWRATTRDKQEFTYGYFEVKCILPAAQGMWSAFWLTNPNVKAGVPGTEATEIDIMESPLWLKYAKQGLVTQNIHYNGYDLGTKYKNIAVTKADKPYEEFNTYGLLWTEDEYVFYVNGKETGRSTFGGVCKEPLYLLLSCEIDGTGGKPSAGWSGLITKNEEDALPADFIIDYVRVYQIKQ